jgi:Probable zinc-ribbon domain
MSEQRLTCADCGRDFPFSAEEQRFFREKGFEPPKRCRECRQARKEQRGDGGRKGGRD